MPSLSPTMTDGTIVKWLKKEGDPIVPGDVLCEIQTDKAVMSFETEEEGILAKIMVKGDSKDIKVGTVIALMVGEGEDWRIVEVPCSSGSTIVEKRSGNISGSGEVAGMNISMPSLSPTMTEGTIIKWHKKEGDTIVPGDVLCDIQTDKAVMSFETEEEGVLAKILISEGSCEVGTVIAVMVSEGENWMDVAIPSTKSAVASESTTPISSTPPPVVYHTEPQNYGPAVRGLLELYGIDKNKISPTGRNKKLLKSDVLNYITANKFQPKPPKSVPLPHTKSTEQTKIASLGKKRISAAKYIDIEISNMRKTIAKRLTESKVSIPHAYATVESNLDLILSLRKQLKLAGIPVSVNDFVVKAVALALRNCPLVNCLYMNDAAMPVADVDISVAVATDNGLITPIIKCADGKTVDDISAEIKELAGRARQGKLQLHEFQGGSFTISNLGMFGISEFSAIINPPQCGILAVGSARDIIDINGQIVTKMTCMLSYDARAISESAAADFLELIQSLIENPASIVMATVPSRKAHSVAAL